MLTTFVLPACSSVVYRLGAQFVAVPNLLAVLALATVLSAKTAANAQWHSLCEPKALASGFF